MEQTRVWSGATCPGQHWTIECQIEANFNETNPGVTSTESAILGPNFTQEQHFNILSKRTSTDGWAASVSVCSPIWWKLRIKIRESECSRILILECDPSTDVQGLGLKNQITRMMTLTQNLPNYLNRFQTDVKYEAIMVADQFPYRRIKFAPINNAEF